MKKLILLGLVSLSIFAFAGVASAGNMVSEMAKNDVTCLVHCAQTMDNGISQCAHE